MHLLRLGEVGLDWIFIFLLYLLMGVLTKFFPKKKCGLSSEWSAPLNGGRWVIVEPIACQAPSRYTLWKKMVAQIWNCIKTYPVSLRFFACCFRRSPGWTMVWSLHKSKCLDKWADMQKEKEQTKEGKQKSRKKEVKKIKLLKCLREVTLLFELRLMRPGMAPSACRCQGGNIAHWVSKDIHTRAGLFPACSPWLPDLWAQNEETTMRVNTHIGNGEEREPFLTIHATIELKKIIFSH